MRDGHVLAGMHANAWAAMEPIRKIVGARDVADALDDETLTLDTIAATLE
jgi:hypothetical protein